MADVRPIPESVEQCRAELEAAGFRLTVADASPAAFAFGLELAAAPDQQFGRFGHLMWTELEAAQAAVRFARYFGSVMAPVNEAGTRSLSLEETQG